MTYDVIVIGAGIVGAACAAECAEDETLGQREAHHPVGVQVLRECHLQLGPVLREELVQRCEGGGGFLAGCAAKCARVSKRMARRVKRLPVKLLLRGLSPRLSRPR